MKTSLTFQDGCHSETVAYLYAGDHGAYVRITGNYDVPARLSAEDCRELAAWLVEAADEIEGREP